MTATARIIALVREHLRAPDDLAARVTLQAIALEVGKLEVRERIARQLAGVAEADVSLAADRSAFEVAMDALSLERSGLKVTP